MKKSIYAAMLLTMVVLLSSVTNKRAYSKPPETVCFTCSAPTGLGASLTGGGTWMTLSWTPGSNNGQWHPGGYYNYRDQNGVSHMMPFHLDTWVEPIGFNVLPGTYSVTFQVTADCVGGGSATSGPFSRTFP